MFTVVKVAVVVVDVCILMKGVNKFFGHRRLMVVGEMEGVGEGHAFWLGLFFAFVGSLMVLGG